MGIKLNELKRQPGSGAGTLDELVALVEKAARALTSLQEKNAALAKEVAELRTAAQANASELDTQKQRIEQLEQSEAALKKENAVLMQQVQDARVAAHARTSELDIRRQRITVLDQSIAALKKDADLCRWMRTRFSNSSFLTHIENLYFSDHPEEKKIQ